MASNSVRRKAKKLKSKVLEDRIAPGMIGGGLVDPGAVDVIDNNEDKLDTGGILDLEGTNIDQMNSDLSPEQSGNFVEENGGIAGDVVPDGDMQDTQMADGDFTGDASELNADAEATEFTGDAPEWQEPDWITPNADGSMTLALPEGVDVNDGIASFPVDMANEELPLPDGLTIEADGTASMQMPEGTEYSEGTNTVMLAPDVVAIDDLPAEMNAFENPDGTISLPLNEGMDFNVETNQVEISNVTFNEMTPPFVDVSLDGSVNIEFPEGTEFSEGGIVEMSPEGAAFFDNPPADMIEGVEWGEMNADGSMTFEPPQEVIVHAEEGLVEIPHEVVGEMLPLEEGIHIHIDGSMDLPLPAGTEFNAVANALTFPEGSITGDEIPLDINSHLNPDATTTVYLADGMQFDAEHNSVHVDNHWANELTPDSIAVDPMGGVLVDLPTETQFAADGSFTLPPEQLNFIDQPAPGYICDADFVDANEDGSYTVMPPEGVLLADGVLDFSPEAIVDHIPMSEEIVVTPDGGLSIPVPPDTTFNPDNNSLTFAQGEVHLNEIPTGIEAFANPDGTMTAYLPDGIEFNAEASTVNMDNHWANEFTPQEVNLTPEGHMEVNLPQDVEVQADGSFILPADAAEFIQDPPPEYVTQGPDWMQANPDGSVTMMPPEGIQIEPLEQTAAMSCEEFNENFEDMQPDEFQLNADGTSEIQLPEGTEYNEISNSLTFSEGEVHLNEIPEGIDAHLNPDGTITAYLPDGIEFSGEGNSIELDNYWTNEITPDPIHIQADGQIEVQLPPETYHHTDGSFTVAEASADFVADPAPAYVVTGPDWVEANPDGSIHCMPPEGMNMMPEEGQLNMTCDMANEQFEDYKPDDFQLNADGSSDHQLPEGTNYDASNNALTFPVGEMHMDEIPPGMDASLNADGSISINLPEGIDFNPDTQSVHMNNYWTNELTPDPIQVQMDGQVNVNLPPETMYHDDGSFTVPDSQADFMENPAPDYVASSPDYVMENPNGSIMVEPPEHMTLDPQEGTLAMTGEAFNEEFQQGEQDGGMHINPDGTADFQLPEGTQFDAQANTITIPAGDFDGGVPEKIEFHFNEDGSTTIHLPDGIEFNPDANAVHMDNYWTNEVMPGPMEVTMDGQVEINLPSDTHYTEDGGFTIPEQSADFMAEPGPDYASEGPDWVSENPDGSVTVQAPDEVTVNAEANTATMSLEFAAESFDIPEELVINMDGSADMALPSGVSFDADLGTLTFPEGEIHQDELPPSIEAVYNADGTFTVTLPEGIDYNESQNSIHLDNASLNEFAPEPIEITENGEFVVHLPEDTQYFADNSFTISPDAANFMDEGDHNMDQQNV